MRNPDFPNDDVTRSRLLQKACEAAELDRKATRPAISDRAFAELERVSMEFAQFFKRYMVVSESRDTVRVGDPLPAANELDEMEHGMRDIRRQADRVIRRICAELNTLIANRPDEEPDEVFRRYGYLS